MSILSRKVAYISDQHYPVKKADAEQVVNTVSALVSQGLDIELLIPKDWRKGRLSNEERIKEITEFYHVANGFALTELCHIPTSRLRIEKYSHGLIAPWFARSKYDLIYTRNPVPAFVAMAMGLPVVYETYKIYNRMNSSIARKLANASHGDRLVGIITHSETSKESLVLRGASAEKIAVIHNGFDPALFDSTRSKAQIRRELNLPLEAKIACYAGRIELQKGLDTILEMAGQTPEITYMFIGETEAWLTKAIQKGNLSNIVLAGWKPVSVLTDHLLASDVLLIPPSSRPMLQSGKTVLPLKLFIYLAAGRPILAPELPDTADLLNNKNAALVPADDPLKASEMLRKLFDDIKWADTIALASKATSTDFTWQSRAKKILQFLDERLAVNG